jgi:hypothetical protein
MIFCANPPMNRPRSPVSGCTRTTRVSGLVAAGGEDVAVLDGLVVVGPGQHVVVVVGVDGPERVGEVSQHAGEVGVGRGGVGDERVPATVLQLVD